MIPFTHQKKFAKGYCGSRIVAHEGGTGKTVCACLWLHDGRDDDAIVICPKRVVKKWQKALKDWGTKAEVVTPDEFKKMEKREVSALVVDEADEFAAPLFVGDGSARSKVLYNFVKDYNPDILLLSATPVRSTPWNLHTILCYAGIYIPWKEFRAEFFELRYPEERGFGYLQHPSWLPKRDWRTKIREWEERYCDIVLLQDCVNELPPIISESIEVKTPEFIITEDDYGFHARHKWEQQNKAKEIIAKGRQFRKVLVVAQYTEQIEDLAEKLSKDKPTFVVHGKTKDQEAELQAATVAEDCYLIVQASIGAGFDGNTFSCIVFASMSYAVRDFVQMMFRVRRIHDLHPVYQVFIFGGECDHAVYENVQLGKDFVPSEWDRKIGFIEKERSAYKVG